MGDLILFRQEAAVAVLTLNRPEKRNALSSQLRQELMAVLDGLDADDSVRCVVLTGQGAVFSAGFDLSEFSDPSRRKALWENSSAYHRRVFNFSKPIIAAIQGAALAGALDLALLCDIRLCDPSARFGHPEVRFGAVPLFSILKNVVGEGPARHLCFSGEPIGAAEALRIGLVTEVVALEALLPRALLLAQNIALSPLATLRYTKQSMCAAAGASFETAFAREHDEGLNSIPLNLELLPRR
ncbi:MAG: enoyl-CoA hydratase/isomerase family protein [Deltaproteobacteria bacterium]|nr:enoyl-CoA hydratase/isomerase family protein [Deltaproteobacteria bacterium]